MKYFVNTLNAVNVIPLVLFVFHLSTMKTVFKKFMRSAYYENIMLRFQRFFLHRKTYYVRTESSRIRQQIEKSSCHSYMNSAKIEEQTSNLWRSMGRKLVKSLMLNKKFMGDNAAKQSTV